MRKPLLPVVLWTALSAQAAPASAESVERLLDVTHVASTLDAMFGGLEQSMRQGMQQALRNKPVDPDKQRALDAFPPKFVAVLQEAFREAGVGGGR